MSDKAIKKDSGKQIHRRPIGPYIPPAKRLKSEKLEPGSEEHQRMLWDEYKRKITGLINRANSSNIKILVRELFSCNLIRYKGLFASAIIKAQQNSPKYTDVYASLLTVINSRISSLGKLVIQRLIIQYRMSFLNDDKPKCLASISFIAHLTNQGIVHEILPLEILHHLLEKPTPFSIEIAVTMLKECGAKLDEVTSRGLFSVFESLRNLAMENDLDARTQDLIDLIHTVRKDRFKQYPPVRKDLDLIDDNDKVTHEIELTEPTQKDYHLEFNNFTYDAKWHETEAKYDSLKKILLGEDDDNASDSESDLEGDESDKNAHLDEADENITANIDNNNCDNKNIAREETKKDENDIKQEIVDKTEADLVAFRRKVYLTIQSSLSQEEAVHKLIRLEIKEEYQDELCLLILDSCGHQRTYIKIYGLISSLLCELYPRTYKTKFEFLFEKYYQTITTIQETNKIRNAAKFFAHLFMTRSINWECMSCIHLRDNATTSPGRCFIKFLFEDLVSVLSLSKVKKLVQDPANSLAFGNIFPKDNELDTRFSINFFTLSGLGSLTDDMRNHLIAKQS